MYFHEQLSRYFCFHFTCKCNRLFFSGCLLITTLLHAHFIAFLIALSISLCKSHNLIIKSNHNQLTFSDIKITCWRSKNSHFRINLNKINFQSEINIDNWLNYFLNFFTANYLKGIFFLTPSLDFAFPIIFYLKNFLNKFQVKVNH